MTTTAGKVPLLVTLGHAGDNSFILRFPPEYAPEILSLLDEFDVGHSTALEHSIGPAEWLEVVQVLAVSSGGLVGLAQVIRAFVHRHDRKRIVLKRGEFEIDAAGYSERDVERFLQHQQAQQTKADAEYRRMLGKTLESDD